MMSVGPLGMAGSIAGTAQSPGSQVDRAKQDATAQERSVQSEQKAETADGVGETAEDEQTADRDADGRRLWERNESESEDNQQPEADAEAPTGRDATGQRGQNLDLSG